MITNNLEQMRPSTSNHASISGGLSVTGFEQQLKQIAEAQKFSGKETLTLDEVVEYLDIEDKEDFRMKLLIGELDIPHMMMEGKYLFNKKLVDEWIVTQIQLQ